MTIQRISLTFFFLFLVNLFPCLGMEMEEVDIEKGVPVRVASPNIDEIRDEDLRNCALLIMSGEGPFSLEEIEVMRSHNKSKLKKYQDVIYYGAVTSPILLLGVLSSTNSISGIYPAVFGYIFSLAGQQGYSLLAKRYEKNSNDYQNVLNTIKKRFGDMSLALARQLIENMSDGQYSLAEITFNQIWSILDSLDNIDIKLQEWGIEEKDRQDILHPLAELRDLINSEAYESLGRLLNTRYTLEMEKEELIGRVNNDYKELAKIITNEQMKALLDTYVAPKGVINSWNLQVLQNKYQALKNE